jgi:hypothetical protein
MGDQYGYNNHRSNYALGSLARAQNDSKLAPFYFSEALKKRPTPYAQVNLGYELLQGDRFFDALFSFREGLDAFPGNPYLHVNLGVTFGKTDVLDSALYYLQEAADEEVSRAAARTNILGLVAKNEDLLAFDLDSLINETNYGEEYLPARVNELLLYNRYLPGKLRQKDVWQVPEDSVLNSFDFAYLYNYAFNSPAVLDSSRRAMLQKLAENPANGNFYEALLLIRAYVLYQNNQVVDAMKTLDYLQSLNPFRRGEYNNILGLWAMQMHAPQVATTYLRKAVAARHDGSLFRHAVAEAEAMALPGGNQREAFQAWDSLRILEKEGIRETQAVVSDMLSIVSGNAALADRDGAFIYQYLRYRAPFMSEAAIGRALDSIEEPSYRVLALHDLMLRFPRRDFEAVKTRANRLLDSKPKLSGQALAYQAWLEVWLLQTQGEEAAAAREASQLEPLSTWHRLKQHYLQATLARQQGEEATARVLARRLLGNPFYEEGFLFALSYLYADEPLRQYELLLDALETYPYSPELLKAYTRSSLQQGLESYAENALEDLRGLLAPEAFASYLQEYESLKEELSVSF